MHMNSNISYIHRPKPLCTILAFLLASICAATLLFNQTAQAQNYTAEAKKLNKEIKQLTKKKQKTSKEKTRQEKLLKKKTKEIQSLQSKQKSIAQEIKQQRTIILNLQQKIANEQKLKAKNAAELKTLLSSAYRWSQLDYTKLLFNQQNPNDITRLSDYFGYFTIHDLSAFVHEVS